MSDNSTYMTGSSIRVRLDQEILHELIYGQLGELPKDDEARLDYQRTCSLREHQVYRLMRSLVSQFNGRLKGRRERFKLVEEGDGLVLELSSS
ncbi:MAG: hypothetical protein EA401_01680 [Planctomycetota bacterium]|nr:MAG: hypothetical protein EA401_01680 [Planctomycetota bacterium]